MKRRVPTYLIPVLLTLFGALLASAAPPPDLGKVDRHIAKEPKYVAQPLYGLYVFGPQARTKVWTVFDKSKPDNPNYDVLYFDRNANGDLTEPSKRIVGTFQNGRIRFAVGSFKDPATGATHTDVTISRRPEPDGSVYLTMMERGRQRVMGGYAEDPGPYTQFASHPEGAPVLWPTAEAPFHFQRWGSARLTIDASDDMRVFLGQRGQGRNTFCAVPEDFLPAKASVLATLIYTDRAGKEGRKRSELKERC
jgi:hypothetical protein